MSGKRGLMLTLAAVLLSAVAVGYVLGRNRQQSCQGHVHDTEAGAGLDTEFIEQYEGEDR